MKDQLTNEQYEAFEKFAVFCLCVGPKKFKQLSKLFYKEWTNEIDSSRFCLDCGVDTYKGAHNYYMVHDAIWLEVVPQDKGMLCLPCLSARLGRELTYADFTDAPVNHHIKDLYEPAEADYQAVPVVQHGQDFDW